MVKIPKNMKAAKICMTWLSHGDAAVPVAPGFAPRVRRGPKIVCAMMAPTLPEAAERPCEVDLYRVGKHSPGTMKVVALGPIGISCRTNRDGIYR